MLVIVGTFFLLNFKYALSALTSTVNVKFNRKQGKRGLARWYNLLTVDSQDMSLADSPSIMSITKNTSFKKTSQPRLNQNKVNKNKMPGQYISPLPLSKIKSQFFTYYWLNQISILLAILCLDCWSSADSNPEPLVKNNKRCAIYLIERAVPITTIKIH